MCSPHAPVRHLESATRGHHGAGRRTTSPATGGTTPGSSAATPTGTRTSRCAAGVHACGPGARRRPPERVGRILGRDLTAYRQRSDVAESRRLARDVPDPRRRCRPPSGHARRRTGHRSQVRTVNWFVPDIDSPFYGGINTALRLADLLARRHGVENRFIVWGRPPDHFVRSALAAAFPSLADCADRVLRRVDGPRRTSHPADAGIATLWTTAYALAHAPGIGREVLPRPGLRADVLPGGHPVRPGRGELPAGPVRDLQHRQPAPGLRGGVRRPRHVLHPGGRPVRLPPPTAGRSGAARRPGHGVRLRASRATGATAGNWPPARWSSSNGGWATGCTSSPRAPAPLRGDDDGAMEHLGLLDYRATGDLYRRSDVGLALTVSRHPPTCRWS